MWKFAVIALLIANIASIAFWSNSKPIEQANIQPAIVPVTIPANEPVAPRSFDASGEPWSLGALNRIGDPNQFPPPEFIGEPRAASAPLTPRDSRSLAFD